ncbi:MAG: hypothetical protein ACLFWH_15605 [Actinomycetota bacterium]
MRGGIGIMRGIIKEDQGVSALWVAVVALFLVAAAALAVDTSGAFNTAQTDQTTADLSCLAGVKELPDDPTTGINLAAEYAVDNWPEMDGHSSSVSGTTGTFTHAGNEIYVDAAYGGDPEKMHVRITEVSSTYFGKAIGADSTTVVQDALCRKLEQSAGTGVPFGSPLGGFTGGMFGPNPCGTNSGNCGSLWIERDDVTGTSETLINNIANGPDRNLDDWLGDAAGSSSCFAVSAGETCHRSDTDTGVSANHIRQGFIGRFKDDPGADCETPVSGNMLNCDTPQQVLGGSPTPLDPNDPPPDGWEVSLHGEYNAANTANHYYYDGEIAKCDSPRLARMPIITEEMNWNIGDDPTGWPPGASTEVKFVGFYWLIIENPKDQGDYQGNLSANGIVMWWGPNTECKGPGGTTYDFDPDNPITSDDVFLVNETN